MKLLNGGPPVATIYTADDRRTFGERAEDWWAEAGFTVPLRGTSAWDAMYAAWCRIQFDDYENQVTEEE